MPKGSVLGLHLFIMYTTPLSSVLSPAKDTKHHLYNDDTQVHTSSFKDSIHNLKNSLVSVHDWMYKNKLKLNPNKTEFLVIGKRCHRKISNSSFLIAILGTNICPTPTARNLGVIFNSDFNFIHQLHCKDL